MRTIITHIALGLILAVVWTGAADAQSPFDKLKKKAKEAIEKSVEDMVEDPDGGSQDAEGKGRGDSPWKKDDDPAADPDAQGQPLDPGAPAPYGRWQGRMEARGKQSLIGHGSLDIVLSEEVNVLRYANAATRCLGEMSGGEGKYEVAFVTGQSFCGTRAELSLSANGALRIHWLDAPDTADDERAYSGTLQHTRNAWSSKWSTSADQRAAFDVVGFHLGMTYEAALAHMDAEHGDLQNELRMIVDAGSTTLVQQLEPKKLSAGQPGEQISLVFEAQTPEEMEVEQDPDVLARREEIKQMQVERSEEIQRRRKDRFDRRVRGEEVSNEPSPYDLPPLPEMPALRTPGADARLLAVHREVSFGQGARPHEQNLMAALTGKYGEPSVRIDLGPVRRLQWSYDAAGNKIADASEGACDHFWKAPGRLEGLVDWYGNKAVFATVHPQCGLTVKVEMRYNDSDRGVWQLQLTLYDQQRLLGDEWDKIRHFSAAYLAEEKAKLAATKQVKAPDL